MSKTKQLVRHANLYKVTVGVYDKKTGDHIDTVTVNNVVASDAVDACYTAMNQAGAVYYTDDGTYTFDVDSIVTLDSDIPVTAGPLND
jgi:hypothetical protein